MRRLLLLFALVITAAALSVAPAFAHVHGITPLIDCNVDSANSGAVQTDSTPAAEANGGPITTGGLIPRDVGNAPLTVGDGGFGAATGHCP